MAIGSSECCSYFDNFKRLCISELCNAVNVKPHPQTREQTPSVESIEFSVTSQLSHWFIAVCTMYDIFC